ncbi:MAG: retroviral-like aspartic protease family protein [Chitinophagales bacterium]|nr:retroviral-like aspartic protease family protein [Chitinophagales bacterium]
MSKKITIPLKAVSLQEEGFHLFVEGKAGTHSIRLLIDTGASKTVLDKKFISEKLPALKLEINEQLTTGVGSNTIQSEFTEIDTLSVGKLKLKKYKVAVLDLQHVNETYSLIQLPGIDGVLGCDVLVDYGVVINLRKMELRIRKESR